MISSTDGPIAVQGDVVLGIGVHQESQSGSWRRVDQEIDVDVSIGDARVDAFHWLRRVIIVRTPLYELLSRDGIRVSCIIDKDRIGFRGDIAVDGDYPRAPLNGNIACGIDSAVER